MDDDYDYDYDYDYTHVHSLDRIPRHDIVPTGHWSHRPHQPLKTLYEYLLLTPLSTPNPTITSCE